MWRRECLRCSCFDCWGWRCGPDCRVGLRRFHLRRLGFRVAGTGDGTGSGERDADLVPGSGDLFCPPPGVVDAESGLPGAVADPGGDVQDPVPERRDLASAEVWFVGEAEQLGPGNEVPSRSSRSPATHCWLHSGCRGNSAYGGLGLPDPVLDPGVLPVPQIQSGQLTGHHPGVGYR